MEAFNETAMKFVPIYYKRVQKQELEAIELNEKYATVLPMLNMSKDLN